MKKKLALAVCLLLSLALALPAAAESAEVWVCLNCWEKSMGNFCGQCGKPRP